jgi:hypothetical protein
VWDDVKRAGTEAKRKIRVLAVPVRNSARQGLK